MEEKLARATFYLTPSGEWSPEEVDKLELKSPKDFKKVVNDCRFNYERDPIASSVINKMVEIGITELDFDQGSLSDNEFRIFIGLKPELQDFAEECALEFLLSGLVIPEIAYTAVNKSKVQELGIKKYSTMTLPTNMFLRDPTNIKINTTFMGEPSYFILVPEEMIYFIVNNGTYPDGTKDTKKYEELLKEFPEFVTKVKNGEREILLENDLIITRKVTTRSPYPIPYLYPALEALKHKRNLRRMDYSIASRVISAIQLFRLGSDEFPVLESDTKDGEASPFDFIKNQMTWRYSRGKDIERIFQLFANHTLQIDWISPDTSELLNQDKYKEVNQDIFFALGFPRILTTGETERTQTSNAEFATLSPQRTMEFMQRQIIKIIKGIVREVSNLNGLKNVPEVRFSKINLKNFGDYIEALRFAYETGNISRTSLDEALGYTFTEEINMRKDEKDLMNKLGLESFEQRPFSQKPTNPNNPNPEEDTEKNDNQNNES